MGKLKRRLDQMDHWPIMEQMIGRELRPRQMISSPIREGDSNPSFGFFRDQQGQARWVDFAYKGGDVYSLAMALHGCSFPDAIQVVARAAGVDEGVAPPTLRQRIVLATKRALEETRAECSYSRRGWGFADRAYWSQYHIDVGGLGGYQIHPAMTFTVKRSNGKVITINHSEVNPLYVYEIGSEGRLKSYRPLASDKKRRYMGNTNKNDVFGSPAPPGTKLSLITAGQKDAIVTRYHTGVWCQAFNSESTTPDDHLMLNIATSAERLVAVYDNDNAGKLRMEILKGRYPFIETFDIAHTGQKDLADIVKNKGPEALRSLVKEIK